MKRTSLKITIKELAALTGFSTATVSYVVNNRQDIKISDATRNKILAVCKAHQYKPRSQKKSSPLISTFKKRITLKEIAEKANVSIATVSYVINNKQNVHISDETRRKVLQICNLLQYSQYKRSSQKKKKFHIGVYFNYYKDNFSLNSKNIRFLSILQQYAEQHDCSLTLLSRSSDYPNLNHTLNGIIGMELTDEDYFWLKTNFHTRIALIDTIPVDPLIFHIYNDMEFILNETKKIFNTANLIFISTSFDNANYMTYISEIFKDDILYVVDSLIDLKHFLIDHKDNFYIFENEELALFASNFITLQNSIVLNDSSQTIACNPATIFLLPLKKKIHFALEYIFSTKLSVPSNKNMRPDNIL